MIIGIDLDDTLIETTKTGNKYLKIFVKDNSITDYHDLDKDEYLRFYGMYLYDIQKCAPLKKGALEVLNYLHSKNIKIVIITPEFCNAHYCELYFSPLYKRVLLCQEIFIFLLYNLVQ